MKLSELNENVLRQVLDVYFKHAYPSGCGVNAPTEMRDLLSRNPRYALQGGGGQDAEWRLGTHKTPLNTKFWIIRERQPRGEPKIYFHVAPHDEEFKEPVRKENQLIKERIESEWEKLGFPVHSRRAAKQAPKPRRAFGFLRRRSR